MGVTVIEQKLYGSWESVVFFVGFHPLKKRPGRSSGSGQKNSEENIEKDSLHLLLMFPRDEGLHLIGPKVIMKLVYMREGLAWFPTVTRLAKFCPTQFEFHSTSLGSVTTMVVNGFYHELLFVVLRYHE